MYLLTPPTIEPVTVAEAKAAARLDGSHWDTIVANAIAAARAVAEHETGQRLMAQTWRHELTDWPAVDEVILLSRPTAVAVSYWTDAGIWQSLAPEAFVWATQGDGVVLAPAVGTTWPALGTVAVGPRVRIDITLGAADAAVVPPSARQFICALVAIMAADPTLTAMDALASSAYLPRMLDPIRSYG